MTPDKFYCDDITPLKQQKCFWVTLDVAMHGAAYGRDDWKCVSGKCDTSKNARVENAGV